MLKSHSALVGAQPSLLTKAEFKQSLNQRLDSLYTERESRAAAIDPVYGTLLCEMRQFILRSGKRLRPYLTYLAYSGLGGRDEDAILDLAASQELFHNFLLIHDDVFDRDIMRYGGPNLSGVYRLNLPRRLSADARNHLADTMAVMGGDVTVGLGFSALIESDFPAELRLEAVRRMERMIFEIAGGEVLDVLIPTFSLKDVTEERLLRVAQYKTASYTFEAPLQLGAIMAQADEGTLAAISRFSLPIGVAFQLADDLLGVFGNEVQLGKSVLSDLREGKRTVLMMKGFELATPAQRKTLSAVLGNPKASYSHLGQARAILDESGARQYVQDMAERLIAQAVEELPAIGFAPAVSQELAELADFSIHRSI